MSKHEGMHVFYFREAKGFEFPEELLTDIKTIAEEYSTMIRADILEPQQIHLIGVSKTGRTREFLFKTKWGGLHRAFPNDEYDEPMRIILLMMKHFMGHNFTLKSTEFKEDASRIECFEKWKPAYYKLLAMGYSALNITPSPIIGDSFKT